MREELLPNDGRGPLAVRPVAVPPTAARSVRGRVHYMLADRPHFWVGCARLDGSRSTPWVRRVVQVLPGTIGLVAASWPLSLAHQFPLSPARVVPSLVDSVPTTRSWCIRPARDELALSLSFLTALSSAADRSRGACVTLSHPVTRTRTRLWPIPERSPSRSLSVLHQHSVDGMAH